MSTFLKVNKMYTFQISSPFKKYTNEIFFQSLKFALKMIKIRQKLLKVYGNQHFLPQSLQKVYTYYTCENVNMFGWPILYVTCIVE